MLSSSSYDVALWRLTFLSYHMQVITRDSLLASNWFSSSPASRVVTPIILYLSCMTFLMANEQTSDMIAPVLERNFNQIFKIMPIKNCLLLTKSKHRVVT